MGSEKTWAALQESLSNRLIDKTKTFITEDAWNLIPDEGKQDILDAGILMVEASLLEAIGDESAEIVKAALSAAVTNWETAGRIRVAAHADEFIQILKDGLVEAAQIVLHIGATQLRRAVLGV